MTPDEQEQAELQLQEFSKKIDFYTAEYTIEILAQKVANSDFIVPEYQREFTWETKRRCRFIESLLMGLPIPFVFLWMNDETGQLEIVDGSQRLRTIEEYIDSRLELDGLERLYLLNGTKFKDLTLARQRKLKNLSIRAVILSDKTDLESRIDLFERINTGSKIANPAEVRRGALRGPFMDFIIEVAMDSKRDRGVVFAPADFLKPMGNDCSTKFSTMVNRWRYSSASLGLAAKFSFILLV